MPALSNARHERFAQGLAKGLPAIKAYEQAGYRPDSGAASRLSGNVSICARVAELQAEGAAKVAITLAKLIEYADEIRRDAHKDGQYAAAVSAVRELGVLTGYRVEKRENTNRTFSDMSDDELADIARAGRPSGAGAAETESRPSKPH